MNEVYRSDPIVSEATSLAFFLFLAKINRNGADKAVILNIVHSELYRIIILPINTIINSSISLLPHLQF
jgi:hypothetical protein